MLSKFLESIVRLTVIIRNEANEAIERSEIESPREDTESHILKDSFQLLGIKSTEKIGKITDLRAEVPYVIQWRAEKAADNLPASDNQHWHFKISEQCLYTRQPKALFEIETL
ncbi:uncharacterized protein CLUP02_11509 [Colletotrichum lupini]|uniref:Uncharacterized protein n=1 Tax=Colletotrichum lupini TaxID=145971 RepID=A0A9Q8SYZ6_9PEZI|nr:uncharacterized protein CLUP02_11509 [Colletotrichum lupini]UQC86010.1 hypothetical protein CLUP02_11509 [Colletotrichum lupini]